MKCINKNIEISGFNNVISRYYGYLNHAEYKTSFMAKSYIVIRKSMHLHFKQINLVKQKIHHSFILINLIYYNRN